MLQADDGAHFGVAAGTQNVARVRKQPGDPNGPGAFVDLPIGKVESALMLIGGTIGQNQLQAQSFVGLPGGWSPWGSVFAMRDTGARRP